jgi:hypothetical protein
MTGMSFSILVTRFEENNQRIVNFETKLCEAWTMDAKMKTLLVIHDETLVLMGIFWLPRSGNPAVWIL